MNALMYVLNEIHNRIPHELLNAGFTIDEQPELVNLTTLDEKILRKVIKKRVLLDANIVGGIETIIPLANIPPTFQDYYYTVYKIPPELTANKEIISALNLTYLPYNTAFGLNDPYATSVHSVSNYPSLNYGNFNPVIGVANRIGDAAAISGALTNAHIELVAYNTILIYSHARLLSNLGLRVILENDSNLNNIQPRSYKNLATLCVLAVKAYLYNKLYIAINSGMLSGGVELGRFSDVLDSYSDAEEQYDTFLREVWAKTAFMNDTTRYNRFLKSMIAPDL